MALGSSMSMRDAAPSPVGFRSARATVYILQEDGYGVQRRVEPKSNGPDGKPCGPLSRGLLSRRRMWVSDIVHIGKEPNDLEPIQAGLVSSEDEYLNTYEQDIRDMLPGVLKLIPVSQIMEATDCTRRMAFYWRSEKHKPRRRQRNSILPLAGRIAREQPDQAGERNVPGDDRQAIRRLAHSLQANHLAH